MKIIMSHGEIGQLSNQFMGKSRVLETGRSIDIGIRNETDRLRTAAIWGPPGVEVAFAQLLDPRVSLFADRMDVVKAKVEAEGFADLLRKRGVEVHEVRDIFANLIKLEGQEIPDDIKQPFFDKALQITDQAGIYKPEFRLMISELLDQDIERYGPEIAYLLNKALILDPKFPLGNAIFSRDTSNVLLGRRVVASMAYDIRKPEVGIYEKVYESLGMENPIEIPEGEKFEGGDAFVHDGVVYIGVGPRTTKGAALQIFKELRDDLNREGFEFAILEDSDAESRSLIKQMDFMHLDMWAMPIAKNKIAVCAIEAARRNVTLLVTGVDGHVIERDQGVDFEKFIRRRGQSILPISLKEQKQFGCNLLNLDEKTVIVPDTILRSRNGKEVLTRLKAVGQEVVLSPLYETTQGYGGAHCMTAQLLRS